LIGWIDILARAWGRRLKQSPNGWPKQSAMWNIAYQRTCGAVEISIPDMSPEVMDFHRAWHSLPGVHRETLWRHYVSEKNQRSPDHCHKLELAHLAVIREIVGGSRDE